MKKIKLFFICLLSLTMLMLLISAVSSVMSAEYRSFRENSRSIDVEMINARFNELTNPIHALMSDVYFPNMTQTEEQAVHTGEGYRLFSLEGAGVVVTQDRRGRASIVTHNDPNDISGSTVIHYNPETQEFVDGANRALTIALGSRLQRHYLRDGGRYTRAINVDDRLHLVNFRDLRGNERMIYVMLETYRSGWWVFGQYNLVAHDLNGNVICNSRLSLATPPSRWWLFAPITFTVMEVNYRNFICAKLMMYDLRISELMHLITHATEHPWARIRCEATGEWVITDDGHEIRVNPYSNQLVDRFGWALFNEQSGLPIVFREGDIVTVNARGVAEQQRIHLGVLLESMTVYDLLWERVDFHMHIIITPFGHFNVPVVNHGTYSAPDFRLLNGQSTSGITMEHSDSRNLNTWQGFVDGINRLFNGDTAGFGIRQIFLIFVAVVLLVFIMPFIAFMLKIVFLIGSPKKKRPNNYYDSYYHDNRGR